MISLTLAFLRRQRVRVGIIVAVLAAIVALTPPNAERYGDRFQIALPLLALGCAATNGSAGEYLLRFAGMLVTVHGTKRALGERPINVRPHGGGHGFPSAHTSSAVFGASSLVHECITTSPVTRGIVILAAGFTGASRMDARAHDIWQILAGALVGWGFERGLRRPGRARHLVGTGLAAIGEAFGRGFRAIWAFLAGQGRMLRYRWDRGRSSGQTTEKARRRTDVIR